MEQRRLRLGDILDDYCTRERRVTNHVVVAMIDDEIKQTRCTTCDAEHPYKGGQAPRKRKKDAPAALYKEVLAGITESEPVPVLAAAPAPNAPIASVESDSPDYSPDDDVELAASSTDDEPNLAEQEQEQEEDEGEGSSETPEDGPVHRRLIRATLPRQEGQKDARPLPEFTVRHSGNRPNGNQRDGNRTRVHGGGGGNGFRAQGGNRFGGPRGNSSRGGGGRPGGGFRSSQQPRSSGGRKRSR
jgi:hypothetical protein